LATVKSILGTAKNVNKKLHVSSTLWFRGILVCAMRYLIVAIAMSDPPKAESRMAVGRGFEPLLTAPKAAVLPLDDPTGSVEV
jgi:hypothetical protein